MTEEMGKTLDDGRAEVEKCAFHCDWFADHAARLSRRRAGRHRRRRGVRHLQSARRRARGHAVEFPVLAGVPLRRAGADGRQRRAAEARQQRARLRAGDRGGAAPGGRSAATCSARCCSPSSDVEALIKDDNVAAVTLTGSVAAGQERRHRGRVGAQEMRARARRLGRLPRARGRRHRRRGQGRGDGAHGQRRPELHRRQALHRRPLDPRAVREGAGRGDARLSRWATRRKEGTKLGPMQSVKARDEIHRQVSESVAQGRAAAARRQGPRPAGRLVSGDGARRRPARASRRTTRRCSARSPRSSPRTTKPTRSASPTPASSASARACSTADLDRGRRIAARGARSRHELRQRERPLGPAHAVRRGQAFRLRPRMLGASASASSSTSRPCT